MDRVVDIREAQTDLPRLVERVEAGEEITLKRAGRPVARIVPFEEADLEVLPGDEQHRVPPDWGWDRMPDGRPTPSVTRAVRLSRVGH